MAFLFGDPSNKGPFSMEFMFSDPRPDLPDTELWSRVLRIVGKCVVDRKRAADLQLNLWTIRSLGTVIKSTHLENKLVPLLIGEGGEWDSEELFQQITRKYLTEFAYEIKLILMRAVHSEV
jgi:hypothetical protein